MLRVRNRSSDLQLIIVACIYILQLQEIIQNADDAGASTVHFYLDNRQHRTQSLIEPALARFQGPALLAYNDAGFTDKDWQSIQDMQQSVKTEDPFKVGKFGIGFNSVYHITGECCLHSPFVIEAPLFWGSILYITQN